MRNENWKKWFTGTVLLFMMCLSGVLSVSAAGWSVTGAATSEGTSYTLTEAVTNKAGGVIYGTPLDTRNGFEISFEYYVGNYYSDPREGFMLVFADTEFSVGSSNYGSWLGYDRYIYGKENFYGIEFDSYSNSRSDGSGQHIAVVKNSGTSLTHIQTVSETISDSTWHQATITYVNGTLTVYKDGVAVLTSTEFDPPDMSYFGFTACTSYYARQIHQIRNISVSAAEASLITLDANGGTCDDATVYALRNYSSGSLPTPEKTGYIFAGWYTASVGGTLISGMNYNFAAVQTIYAQWTANNYTVTFDANGGSTGTGSADVTYDSSYGTLPVPTRTGYTFSGWFTESAGGSQVSDSTIVTMASDHTLYAHWSVNKYKVTFNPNGGKVSKKSKSVEYNTEIGSFPTPKRSGYTFLGWYTKKSGGKKISSSTVITKKTIYYAHWAKNTAKVTIKLNKNGGKCSKTKITTTYGGKLGSLPTPTRSGYTFAGWYTAKTGGKKVTASTRTKTVLANKTLYAQWTKNSSSDTSNSSSGSSSSSSGSRCGICGGDGKCTKCGGSGYIYSYITKKNNRNCTSCNTSGKCIYCGGDGWIG